MAVARRAPVSLIALLALSAAFLLFPLTDVAIAADPATGGAAEPWSVAVLDFEAMDVPAELARTAAESLSVCLQRTGRFRVLGSQDVRAATKETLGERESAGEPIAEPDAGPICSDASCAVATGEKLGANSVVIGSVSEFGKMLSISIQVFNVYTGEASGDWKAESFEGQEDMPEVVRHLAKQVADAKPVLERGGRVTPEIVQAEEEAAAAQFEASFTLGVGFGLWGKSETKLKCVAPEVSMACSESKVNVKWLANVGFYGRLKKSRLVFGFRGGGIYTEAERDLDRDDPTDDFSYYKDEGFHFYLYPILGYVITEYGGSNLLAYGGAGYRNFTDDSGVSSTFAALGLAAQVYKINLEIAYWYGFDSDKTLQNLVTLDIGYGTGF